MGDWLLGPAARHPAPGHHAALDTGEGQAPHTQGGHIGYSICNVKYLNIYVVIHNIICQALQHPDNFLPDYISGPVYGDRALAMALHRRAR